MPETIVVGVSAFSSAPGLHRTLESLLHHGSSAAVRVVILAREGQTPPEASLYREVQVIHAASGTAGAFLNALLAIEECSIAILLEEGAIAAPGWLESILAAFSAFPDAGSVGPSTNRSRGMQGVMPRYPPAPDLVAGDARELRARFRSEIRVMPEGPEEFCYAVRRAVAAEIGPALETSSFAEDYNRRLRQHGRKNLWACSALVYRDRGPLPTATLPGPIDDASQARRQNDVRSGPLASCIMPTYNRRPFITRAIEYFLRQDYPARELVVVDDGTDPVSDLIPRDPRIAYIRLAVKTSIGAKRNLACERARGEIILHWDDDDWHAPDRIRYQVGSLLDSGVDLCGISTVLFYDLRDASAWLYRYPAGARFWTHGNSLCYRRAFWENNRFAEIDIGEDTRFLWGARTGRMLSLADGRCHVSMIHSGNVAPKDTGTGYWHRIPPAEIERLLGGDLTFYETFRQPPARGLRRFDAAQQPDPDPLVVAGEPMARAMDDRSTLQDRSTPHCGYRIARETDLKLIEFAAFNHSQDLPYMRRWELPWAIFAAQLGNTMAVLDCTINPAGFGDRIARLYPNVHYRHLSPVQQGVFQLPFGVPDESFDRVFCINTLEHLVREQREALIADLVRKLKPGGRLLLSSDHYSDSCWNDAAFLNAGVMRADRAEFFGGWNSTTVQDWSALAQKHGLIAIDPGSWEDPKESDPGCFRNPAPLCHTVRAAVFSKGQPAGARGKRILLALLTWNTRDISVESVRAYAREARMLARLGCEPSICVCDNGSTDGTREALRGLESQIDIPCKLILNSENTGNSVARNQIIDYMMESGSDYLLFMDGDIEIVPFSSFAMMRYMENRGHRLGCIGADSGGQTPDRHRASPFLYAVDGMRIEEVNLVAWTQYGMFRRAIFEEGVRFDESGPFTGPGWGFEDNDLAFQMELKGFRNQRFFGMVYLHRAARSSVGIMRRLGFDPNVLCARRKQHVIDKWESVPHINDGPLTQMRRIQMHL